VRWIPIKVKHPDELTLALVVLYRHQVPCTCPRYLPSHCIGNRRADAVSNLTERLVDRAAEAPVGREALEQRAVIYGHAKVPVFGGYALAFERVSCTPFGHTWRSFQTFGSLAVQDAGRVARAGKAGAQRGRNLIMADVGQP
jgi:hypothetical protein